MKDAELCKGFRSIIAKGSFEVQGEAVTRVAAFFRWFETLDKRIEETVREVPETIRKDLGQSE